MYTQHLVDRKVAPAHWGNEKREDVTGDEASLWIKNLNATQTSWMGGKGCVTPGPLGLQQLDRVVGNHHERQVACNRLQLVS